MARAYSLAYLTSAPLGPVEAIDLAASLGYHHVGLRIAPASLGGECAPLIADRALLDATCARIRATGVTVFDVEIVRLAADFAVESVKPFLDVCRKLGASAVLVAGDDPDEGRLTASYAALCEAARNVGVTCDLEFMPWTAVPDCRTARRIVEASGQPNARILVDSLHAARSATTLAELAALPRDLLSYAQICDAPGEIPATVEGLIHTARCARLLPGDGGIDLRAIFAALPHDVPVSIEIPNDVEKPRRGVAEWARQAKARAQAILEPKAR
jgi:sugar phosphate isomerase/epimerase